MSPKEVMMLDLIPLKLEGFSPCDRVIESPSSRSILAGTNITKIIQRIKWGGKVLEVLSDAKSSLTDASSVGEVPLSGDCSPRKLFILARSSSTLNPGIDIV